MADGNVWCHCYCHMCIDIVVLLGDGTEHLNRECSVFTDDSRYIIVGSAVNVSTDPPPTFFEVQYSI